LLLLVYSFVFTFVMTAAHDPRVEPYALFMFCGILRGPGSRRRSQSRPGFSSRAAI